MSELLTLAWLFPLCALVLVGAVVAVIVRYGWVFVARSHPKWRECDDCVGWGYVMLDGSPIPPDLRSFSRKGGHGTFRGQIANTKACSTCLGLGHTWYDEEGPRAGLVEKRPFEKWEY